MLLCDFINEPVFVIKNKIHLTDQKWKGEESNFSVEYLKKKIISKFDITNYRQQKLKTKERPQIKILTPPPFPLTHPKKWYKGKHANLYF